MPSRPKRKTAAHGGRAGVPKCCRCPCRSGRPSTSWKCRSRYARGWTSRQCARCAQPCYTFHPAPPSVRAAAPQRAGLEVLQEAQNILRRAGVPVSPTKPLRVPSSRSSVPAGLLAAAGPSPRVRGAAGASVSRGTGHISVGQSMMSVAGVQTRDDQAEVLQVSRCRSGPLQCRAWPSPVTLAALTRLPLPPLLIAPA